MKTVPKLWSSICATQNNRNNVPASPRRFQAPPTGDLLPLADVIRANHGLDVPTNGEVADDFDFVWIEELNEIV